MLKELLRENRSIRSFDTERKISKEELLDIIDTTRLCPSSANIQPLKYRPVYTKEECEKVFKNTRWAGYLKDEVIPPVGCEPTAYIVILHDGDIAKNRDTFQKDTGIAAQTMLLYACEMGLSGCMIGSFDEKEIKEALGLPENLSINLVIALGKANESPVLTEAKDSVKYYRKDGVHYVPKRSLEEITVE